MNRSYLLAAAALVLVLAGFLVWKLTSRDALEPMRPLDRSSASVAPFGAVREVADASDASSQSQARVVAHGAGVHLFGSISRRDGRELRAGAVRVNLLDERAEDRATNVTQSLLYSYTGLHAGRVWLSIEANGCCSRAVTIDLTDSELERRVDVALEAQTRLDIRLVTANGEPMTRDTVFKFGSMNARVSELDFYATVAPISELALPSDDRQEFIVSKTFVPRVEPVRTTLGVTLDPMPERHMDRRNGKRERDDVPEGCLAYLESAHALPLWVSALKGPAILMSQLVASDSKEVVFAFGTERKEAQLCRVRANVVDAMTRKPMVGACVWLGSHRFGTENGPEPLTDENGEIDLGAKTLGWNELQVIAQGYETLVQGIEIPNGPTQNLGTIEMRAITSIEGRIVDDQGRVVVAAIESRPFESVCDSPLWPRSTSTAMSGSGPFELTKAGRGRNVVCVREASWVSRPVVVDTTAGPVKDLVLRCVAPSKVAIFVPTTTASDVVLRLETDDGLPVFEDFTLARERIDVAVAKGKYVLRLGRGKERILERAFEVRGEGLTLDLTR